MTESAVLSVTSQLAAPVQAPPQEEKTALDPGVSVSVTCVFCGNVAEHAVGQLIPAGLLVTVPLPDPDIVTVNCSPGLNAALTVWSVVIVTAHAPVPEHAPLQLAKKSFCAGVAVSCTVAFAAKVAAQAVGQLIPCGLLVTVPSPAAATLTVN